LADAHEKVTRTITGLSEAERRLGLTPEGRGEQLLLRAGVNRWCEPLM